MSSEIESTNQTSTELPRGSYVCCEQAPAVILLKEFIKDITDWATTANKIRTAMNGNIISVHNISPEAIAELQAQERTLRGLKQELLDRIKMANISLD